MSLRKVMPFDFEGKTVGKIHVAKDRNSIQFRFTDGSSIEVLALGDYLYAVPPEDNGKNPGEREVHER
jgi:hypothetical protein